MFWFSNDCLAKPFYINFFYYSLVYTKKWSGLNNQTNFLDFRLWLNIWTSVILIYIFWIIVKSLYHFINKRKKHLMYKTVYTSEPCDNQKYFMDFKSWLDIRIKYVWFLKVSGFGAYRFQMFTGFPIFLFLF